MAVKSLCLNAKEIIIIDIPDTNERCSIELDHNKTLKVHNDKCTHRGGPLHLCKKDKVGNRFCPWHGRKVSKKIESLLVAVIFIRSTQQITIVRSANETDNDIWPLKIIHLSTVENASSNVKELSSTLPLNELLEE